MFPFAEVIIVMTDNRIKNRTVHMKRRVYARHFAELVGAVGLDRLEVFLSTATAFLCPLTTKNFPVSKLNRPNVKRVVFESKIFQDEMRFAYAHNLAAA